ncbi:MAG TPA: YdeI/OmpD-associated family protein [Verrucomicrobiae bacterium]|nr:YdeI/OmpD-associated family protein [Verrucomicrobiae bacterium]
MKTQSRTQPIPPAMQRALAANVKARAAFARLPASHQREYVRWITEAKRPETVARRLEKLMPMLLAKADANR